MKGRGDGCGDEGSVVVDDVQIEKSGNRLVDAASHAHDNNRGRRATPMRLGWRGRSIAG